MTPSMLNDTPLHRMPDSYPHFTNGGEKQDERPQEAFASRASLSRWFAIPEDHHGGEPDSHPGAPPPSRRCPGSWWQARRQSARPTPQASEAQSPREQGVLVLHEHRHAIAAIVQQEETTDPASGSGHQRFAIAVPRCDTRF